MRGKFIVVGCLLMVAAVPARPTGEPRLGDWLVPMADFCFPSGLRFVVQEDHARPLVAVAAVYEGGSRADPAGREGTAHVAEHAWFRSAHAGGDVRGALGAAGVIHNAETTDDTTRFEAVGPPSALPTLLAFEAERLARGLEGVADADVVAERTIVAAESHRVGRAIFDRGFAALRALAFPAGHPYHRAAVETDASLAQVDRAGVVAWAARQWRPGNLTLVVAGDITRPEAWGAFNHVFPDAVLGLAPGEAYRPGACPVRIPAVSPPPPAPVTTTAARVPAPVDEPMVLVAWSVPGAMRPGEADLNLIADVLSQLTGAYVDWLVADETNDESVACDVAPGREASLLYCHAEVDPTRTPERVRHAVTTAAAELRSPIAVEGTFAKGFERSWRQAKGALLDSLEDLPALLSGRAGLLGEHLHATGSPTYTTDHLRWMDAVTAASVQTFARTWLTDARQVAVVLEPGSEPALPRAEERVILAAHTPPAVSGVVDGARLAARYALPSLSRTAVGVLESGLRIAALQVDGAPRVRAGLYFRGGEDTAPSGAVDLLSGLGAIPRYTPADDRDARDPSFFYGRWLPGVGSDVDGAALLAPAGNLDSALFLLRDRIDHTTFDRATATTRAADLGRAAALSRWKNFGPGLLAWRRFAPGDDRVPADIAGWVAAARAVPVTAAEAWWRRVHQPANATLVIVGNVDPQAAVGLGQAWFRDWKGPKEPGPPPEARRPAAVVTPDRTVLVTSGRAGVAPEVGLRCVTGGTLEARALLGEVVGVAAAGRLREERGASYGIDGVAATPLPGLDGITLGGPVDPDAVGLAVRTFVDVVAAAANGVDPGALDTARLRHATAAGLALQDTDALFRRVAWSAVWGADPWEVAGEPTRLAAVTAEEVTSLARRCAGHEVLTAVGPEEALRAQLAAVGLPAAGP